MKDLKHLRMSETCGFIRRWYAPFLTMREVRDRVQPWLRIQETFERQWLNSPLQAMMRHFQNLSVLALCNSKAKRSDDERTAMQQRIEQAPWNAFLNANRRDGNIADIDAAVDRCLPSSRLKRRLRVDSGRDEHRALLVVATKTTVSVPYNESGRRVCRRQSFGDLPGDADPELMRDTLGRAFGKVTRSAGRRLGEALVAAQDSWPGPAIDVMDAIDAAEIARLIRSRCSGFGRAGSAALEYLYDGHGSRPDLARRWRVTEKQIRCAEPKVQRVISQLRSASA